MALYADVGIPVVSAGGGSTITDDPVGPTWDQVWSFAGLSQGGATIPLADAERILSLATGDDSPMAAGTRLEDLRASAGATDPRAQLIARFVAGRSVAHGFADPLDAASTGDSVGIDAATLSLLLWAGLRDGMIAAAGDGTNGLIGFTGRAPLPQRPTARTSICSTPTDEEGWVLWLEKLAGGGLDIKGVGSIPGVSQFFTQAFGNRAGTASKALAGAGVVVSLISLIAMLKSMNVTGQMSPSPLERNKDRSDGKQATITITLSFDSKAKGTAAELACAANVLARGLGLELTLPIDGAPISGSDVLVTAGKNFPDKIYFADAASTQSPPTRPVTPTSRCRATRAKELPDTATKIDDTFGIRSRPGRGRACRASSTRSSVVSRSAAPVRRLGHQRRQDRSLRPGRADLPVHRLAGRFVPRRPTDGPADGAGCRVLVGATVLAGCVGHDQRRAQLRALIARCRAVRRRRAGGVPGVVGSLHGRSHQPRRTHDR
jgi:hypothetical protein